MFLRLVTALKSAGAFKEMALGAAKGVGKAKRFAKDIQANHFSLAFERAKGGDVDEQFDVAERYYEGRGIEQSFEDAAIWFERAANGGHPRGQTALALMLTLGRGVKRDPVEAWKWIEIARRKENESANEIAKKIRGRISTEELQEGRSRAAHWRPSVWRA